MGRKVMNQFSKRSLDNLKDLHPDLRKILFSAIKITDFSVICCYRAEHEQNKLHDEGMTHVRFPHSNHNQLPSLAVDIAPYPSLYQSTDKQWNDLAVVIKHYANLYSTAITWGGDWPSLTDKPHFQLDKPKKEDNNTQTHFELPLR